MSAPEFLLLTPWAVIIVLALILIYKVLVVALVRSSKTDIVFRDRWTGIWVRRGRRDTEPSTITNTKPSLALRSVGKSRSVRTEPRNARVNDHIRSQDRSGGR